MVGVLTPACPGRERHQQHLETTRDEKRPRGRYKLTATDVASDVKVLAHQLRALTGSLGAWPEEPSDAEFGRESRALGPDETSLEGSQSVGWSRNLEDLG